MNLINFMRGGKRLCADRKRGFAAIEAEKARQLIVKKLETQLGPIVEKAIKQAKAGDKHAREWLVERAYGKTLQVQGRLSITEPRSSLSKERLLKIAELVMKRGGQSTD